jgi:tetratricopeptide (TPR) repeat protein
MAKEKSDSLITVFLNENKPKTERTSAMFKMVKLINSERADTCISIISESLKKETWDKKDELTLILVKAIAHKSKWDLDKGVDLLLKNISQIPEAENELLVLYEYHIGRGYLGLSNYPKSVEYLMSSLEKQEKSEKVDYSMLSTTYYSLAINAKAQRDFINAIKWNEKASKIATNNNDTSKVILTLSYQAILLMEQPSPKFLEAEKIYRNIFYTYKRSKRDVSILSNFGYLFEIQNKLESAQ